MTIDQTIALGIFTLVLLAGTSGKIYRVVGRADHGSKGYRCPSEGFHADPEDCRNFYRCVNWNSKSFFKDVQQPMLTSFQFTCGAGTVFEPSVSSCVHPGETSRRECSGSQMQRQMPFPTGHPSRTNQNQYNSLHRYSSGFHDMYEPNGYGNGFHMNEYDNQIQQDSGECRREGFQPVEGDCKMFMRCADNGQGGFYQYLYVCAGGTVWDQRIQTCNYPESVPGCGRNQNHERYPGEDHSNPLGPGSYPHEGGPEDHFNEPGHPNRPDNAYLPPHTNQGTHSSSYPHQGSSPAYESQSGDQNRPMTGSAFPNEESPFSHQGPNYVHHENTSPQQGTSYPTGGSMYIQHESTSPQHRPTYTTGDTVYVHHGPISPEQGSTYPTEGPVYVHHGISSPHQGSTYPVGTPVHTQQETTSPHQGPSRPHQGSTSPTVGSSHPQQEPSRPQKGSTSPTVGSSYSPQGPRKPQQGSKSPTVESSNAQQGTRYPQQGSTSSQDVHTVTSQTVKPLPGNQRYPWDYSESSSYPMLGNSYTGSSSTGGTSTGSSGYSSSSGGDYGTGSTSTGSSGYSSSGGDYGTGTTSTGSSGYSSSGGDYGTGSTSTGTSGYSSSGVDFGDPSTGSTFTGSSGFSPEPTPGGYPSSGINLNQDKYPTKHPIHSSQTYPGHSTSQTGITYPNQGTHYPQYPEDNFYGNPHPTDEGSSPTSGSEVPSGNPKECQRDGFFGVEGHCTKFYRCVDNGKGGFYRYDFVCGPGTVWDHQSTTCNHPWAANRPECSSTSTTDSSQSGGQDSTSYHTTPSLPQQPNNPYGSQATISSQTTQTTSQPSTKPTSQTSISLQTTTSSYQETTDDQSQQNTSFTEASIRPPTTESQTQTAPPGSIPSRPNNKVKCEKGGFYPDPSDCKKFYRCVDWDGDKGKRFSVYHFQCADGTIWDPALEACNHEDSVYPPRDCGSGSQSSTISGTDQDSTTVSSEENTSETDEPTTDSTTEPEMSVNTDSTEDTSTDVTDSTKPTDPSTDKTTTEDSSETEEPSSQTSMTTTMTESSQNPTEISTDDIVSPETTTSPEETNMTTQTVEETTDNLDQQSGGSSQSCPSITEDQAYFVCPTGFRRHPKNCNLFYQCTISDDGDVNVMTFACKNETLYDERKIQCLPPDETDACPSLRRSKRRIEPELTHVIPVTPGHSLCPEEGYFSYEGDCRRFFKCQKDKEGRMQGYLYQCPQKYSFSNGKCEKSSALPKCSRPLQSLTNAQLKWMAFRVPTEYLVSEMG